MLHIIRPIYQTMLAHVQVLYPLEGCGLLAGEDQVITHLYAIENRLHSATRFEMEPLQQVQAMLDMEAQGYSLLAIYHSHPQGPPVPSKTDVTQAYYPEVGHLIVSLQDRARPSVRAFTIADGRVTELPLIVE